MSYTIVLRIDNDDDADSDPLKAVWVIDHLDTLDEAIEAAREIVEQEYERTGVEAQRLDLEEVAS